MSPSKSDRPRVRDTAGDLVYEGALLGPVAVGSVLHLARLVTSLLITSLLVTSLLVTSLLVTSLLVVSRLVQARKAQAEEETGGLGDLGEGGVGGAVSEGQVRR